MFILFLLIFLVCAVPIYLTKSISNKVVNAPVKLIEIGQIFIWIVFLYAFFPLVGIALSLSGVGLLNEDRLGGVLPDYDNVIKVGASYFLFMLGFSVTYLRIRKFEVLNNGVTIQKANWADLRFAVLILLALKITVQVIYAVYGGATDGDYISSYTALRGQSIFIQQIANLASTSEFAATILVFVTALAYEARFVRILFALVVVQVLVAVFSGGGRTYAFLSAFAFFVARSFFYKTSKLNILYAVIGIGLFLIAGLIRSEGGLSTGELNLEVFQHGEFVAVFCNSLDLLDKANDLGIQNIGWGMYFVDLLRFIPQQIIGNWKIDPAVFYVSTFYPEYYKAGGGFAFGAIAESSLGLGPIEALIRGLLLGWVYAQIANRCLAKKISISLIFIYVWFVVISYQAIRDTTFTALPRFFFQVIPMLLLIRLTGTFRGEIFLGFRQDGTRVENRV